jgi:SAM-dependent methyltransferase
MVLTYTKIIIYLLEYQMIRAIARIMGWPISPNPKLSKQQKQTLNQAFKALTARWSLLIRNRPEINPLTSPGLHFRRYQLVLRDLKSFLQRKDQKNSSDLSGITFEEDCPEYFKRNYHYQTDGYLSYPAAFRYDHQIEILFLGTGHIMRKVAYSVLLDVLQGDESVLEFGAGTGTSGHQFKMLFPRTRLDILEPGRDLLSYAKDIYPDSFHRIIPGFMEQFKTSEQYDCIFSCFVMHEIPVEFWDAITRAIKACLRPGGHLLIIDSQQNNDKAEHQFALDQFAEDFYEPYFPEFREKSLEEYFQHQGFQLMLKEEVLFSKALLFRSASNG